MADDRDAQPADPTGATLNLALRVGPFEGCATPDGWALLAPDQGLVHTSRRGAPTPLLVSLADGSTIPVPVQPVFTQTP